MTPGQQFTIAILHIVVPAFFGWLAGLHQPQPSYMQKKTPESKEEG